VTTTIPAPAAVTVPVEIGAPAASTLEAGSAGFWPSPESNQPRLVLRPGVGSREALVAWRLLILPEAGESPVRGFSGKGAELPLEFTWDGGAENAMLAPAGRYRARLELDYGKAFTPGRAESSSFLLSREPPRPSLRLDPPILVPTEEGVKEALRISSGATPALAALAGWQLDVLDPAGTVFIRFDGEPPVPAITWDGRNDAGKPLAPGADYAVVLSVRDEYGNIAVAKSAVSVAALPDAGESASVAALGIGLSPNADGKFDSLAFSLGYPRPESVSAWSLEIRDEAGGLFRGFAGTRDVALPKGAQWNGKDDTGAFAPDGRYRAEFRVELGRTWAPVTARSDWFILDRTPPVLSLSSEPSLFSPDGDGRDDVLTIEGKAEGGVAPAMAWNLAVHDRAGAELASFSGEGGQARIDWDGKSGASGSLEYAEDYVLRFGAVDSLGNEAATERAFGTDFLVVAEAGGYRVAVPAILFKAFTDDWRDIAAEFVAQNSKVLDRLAKSLNRFPDYRIRLVGHAVMVFWDQPEKGRVEQEEVLIPLSLARATAIAQALSERGVDPARFTVEGVGAGRPLVPNSDLENRWQNRRVEFFLERD
jgi:flagellar hook assembly protein FlgD